MPMTITEKILARAAGKESVSPGELIMARVDFCLGNDITAPVAIDEFEKAGFASVFDAERIALIPDHFTPNKDIKTAELVKQMREFAAHHGITHFYDVGRELPHLLHQFGRLDVLVGREVVGDEG